jgi:putative ABC transport system permease protein
VVSLARKNLLEDIPRFLVAQAGIMFAVSLVTIQTGIFNGFTRSTTQLIRNSDADLWVASESLVHIELTLPIPLTDLIQAQQVVGVERAEALIIRGGVWRHSLGEITPVRVIGFNPQGQLFAPRNIIQGSLSALEQPYTAIVDTTNLNSLNVRGIGDVAEVSSLPAKVVGLTQGNRSIASNSFMFTSLESANAYANSGQTANLSCKLQSGSTDLQCTNTYVNKSQSSTPAPKKLAASDLITYVLIKAKPGEDLQVLKQKLEAALPNTRAYTRAELAEKTQTFWQRRTGIGFLLGLGAAVGIIVGVIIVAQILYSSVSDHLKEFGTLKAMGASDWVLYGVIVEQALWMAILGYLPGIVLCFGVGAWTFATQGILILITPATAIAVFGITILMCVGSAIFAIQKVTRLDPAIVFKA